MFTVFAHVYLARRLRWSMVYDESGERVFMAKHLMECLAWCQEEGHDQVTVSDGETALVLHLRPADLSTIDFDAAMLTASPPKKGQTNG